MKSFMHHTRNIAIRTETARFKGQARRRCLPALLVLAFCSSVASGTLRATPVYFADNGHYYESVAGDHISWSDALAGASSLTFNGQQGYLATITSQAEQDFLYSNFGSIPDLWVGGSDAASLKDWFWVTGPESGLQFYSSTSGAVTYAQPSFSGGDNSGGEYYLVWNHLGIGGSWNDYGPNGRGIDPPSEPLSGYLVEFGGLSTVPEPGSVILMGCGMAVLLVGIVRRR